MSETPLTNQRASAAVWIDAADEHSDNEGLRLSCELNSRYAE